jgi:hypothetical protein
MIDPDKFAEENPNSRFRITNVATLAPGTCILCKSDGGDGRQFIDLGITVDWFGAMYFCTFCIREAASLLGLRDSLEAESHIIGLMDSQKAHVEIIKGLREEVNAARTLLRNCHCDSIGNVDTGNVVDVEAIEESESNDSDPDESGSVEESGNISETSGDDEPDNESAKPKRGRRSNSATE